MLSIAEHLELVGDHGSFMVDREAAAVVARDRIAEFSIKGSPGDARRHTLGRQSAATLDGDGP